eukprot:TRINITY_DN25150_c0_g1_i1.p1 TRINITY_DN25150_c0_g1~~TRINITY_DN25150_c0_g1_i1.p1  ORF type:complete len:422 (-),score=73.72 TRINITY_DN25150_c0_g1_i1:464-1729(-)
MSHKQGGGGGHKQNKDQSQKKQKWSQKPNQQQSSHHQQHQHQQHQQQEQQDYNRHRPFLPPGADVAEHTKARFGDSFDPNFHVPHRLLDKPSDLVEAVNDFHYAMVNDFPRNEFYKQALAAVITPDSMVLEIGTGTGLLAMISAQLGAKWVVAIEANADMANLARQNIHANNLDANIHIINKLSTQVHERDLQQRANVLVSELFGTLLLGESAHTYIDDARKRLLTPNAAIVPQYGAQYASLIECDELDRITAVKGWGGLDLSKLNSLKDTASVVFTKSYGFRFSTTKYTEIAAPFSILDVDFASVDVDEMEIEKHFKIKAAKSGIVHAILLHWACYSDKEHTHVMSTHPEATRDNFPRDMQWGQALQLIEDTRQPLIQQTAAGEQVELPAPFVVTEGEELDITVRFSEDGVVVQFELAHA